MGAGRDLVQSDIPGFLLLAAMPMHLIWFIGGVKGHIRRRNTGESGRQTPDEASLAIDEQSSSLSSNMTTAYPPCNDPSPSLGSASPGDTPLLTPLCGPMTTLDHRITFAEGYFPQLGDTGDMQTESTELGAPRSKMASATNHAVQPGTLFTAESILAIQKGRSSRGL